MHSLLVVAATTEVTMYIWLEQQNIDTREPIVRLCVDGTGFWSAREAEVGVTGLDCLVYDHADLSGELRVYFNTGSWDVDQHGLIYTDPQFITDLRAWLLTQGYKAAEVFDILYSEQGMQGDDYVSFDVGPVFVRGWLRKTAH
jgi:hypothetical protein